MMSRPVLPEPPAKRHRAQGEDREHYEVEGGSEEDEEFHRLEAVSAVQDELNALEEEEAQQVLLVHKAFLKRKRPLYAKRQEAIADVPDFWLKVLLAHPVTQPWVSDVDQLALSYLESVTVHKASSSAATNAQQKDAGGAAVGGSADGDEGRKKQGGEGGQELGDDDDVGFRVTFAFRENPFFSNVELWKEWESAEAQQAAFSVVGWKDTEEAKEVQSCLLCNLDLDAELEETPSFFSIFCEDMEDYELGEALRGDITDNPLDIYMRHDYDAEAEEDFFQEEVQGEEGSGRVEEGGRHASNGGDSELDALEEEFDEDGEGEAWGDGEEGGEEEEEEGGGGEEEDEEEEEEEEEVEDGAGYEEEGGAAGSIGEDEDAGDRSQDGEL